MNEVPQRRVHTALMLLHQSLTHSSDDAVQVVTVLFECRFKKQLLQQKLLFQNYFHLFDGKQVETVPVLMRVLMAATSVTNSSY